MGLLERMAFVEWPLRDHYSQQKNTADKVSFGLPYIVG